MSHLFSWTASFTRTQCSRHLSKRMLRCAFFTLPDDFLNLFVVEQFLGPGLSSTSCNSGIVGLKARVDLS